MYVMSSGFECSYLKFRDILVRISQNGIFQHTKQNKDKNQQYVGRLFASIAVFYAQTRRCSSQQLAKGQLFNVYEKIGSTTLDRKHV